LKRKRYKTKEKITMTCPLCGKTLKGYDGYYWCPKYIKFQASKRKFHFSIVEEHVDMIVPPYRVRTNKKETKVAIHIPPDHPHASKAYKTGRWLFKTIFTCPPIQPMEEEKLLNKIKTLVVFL